MDKKTEIKSKNGALTDDVLSGTNWEIFNIPLFGSQMPQVLSIVDGWISSRLKNKWIATVNPEFVIKATKDDKFLALLKETDLNVMDGIGLIWAKELDYRSSIIDRRNFIKKLILATKVGVEILKGQHKNELVSGADLMPELCKMAAKKGYKVFFLGGFGNRAERTAKFFVSKNLDRRSSIVDRRKKMQVAWSSGEPDFSNKQVLEKIIQAYELFFPHCSQISSFPILE